MKTLATFVLIFHLLPWMGNDVRSHQAEQQLQTIQSQQEQLIQHLKQIQDDIQFQLWQQQEREEKNGQRNPNPLEVQRVFP